MPRTSFYEFTTQFSERVGNVGSFIWASYAGLWHFREKAIEFGKMSSAPEWQKISDNLSSPVPNARGIDLEPLVTSPWASIESSFCDMILTQGASAYEEWCVEMAKMTATLGKKVKAETFQFPSGATSGKWTNWSALEKPGVLPISNFINIQIRPGLMSTFASDVNQLNAVLKWYRHFKEIRNAVAHHGGLARKANEEAYDEAIKVSLKSIGVRRDYSGPRPEAGKVVAISVADATLFLSVVQRLAVAFDAKFCHTPAAEIYLISRVKSALTGVRPPGAATHEKKLKWINGFLRRGVCIYPASLDEMEKWLRTNGLINIKTQFI